MTKECEVCAYLSQYEDEETISYVNDIIKKGLSYENIKKECHIKPVPSANTLKKHKEKCLKDFVIKKPDTSINNNILDTTVSNETNLFTFKSYEDVSGENRVINLKKEWLSISEKLTQIVSYNVSRYNPDKVTTSENIKETVANLKTISDLIRSEFTFEFLKKETNIFDVLNDEEVRTVREIIDNAQKRQEELNRSK
jgi:hypothetical protein